MLIRIIQWFPTFFDAFLPRLILELFIPPLLHNSSKLTEKVQTSLFAMTQITRCGLKHNPLALRPFNKPLLYDN